jgi:hypothetical protein
LASATAELVAEGRKNRQTRSEVETAVKQNNLTHEDAVNRQIWQKATDKQQPE